MSAVRPQSTPVGSTTPWLILGAAAAGYGLGFVAWLGGRIAAVLSGHPWDTGPDFGTQFFRALLRGQTEQLWPRVPTWLVATVVGVLAAALITLVVLGWLFIARHRPRAGDPLASLATPYDVKPLTPKEILVRGQRLRPSLADRPVKAITLDEVGLPLGNLRPRGPKLHASIEDVILAIMAPRSMKTTSLAIPIVLSAPGAAVATSNKADLWAATVAARTTEGRTAWVFDPQSIAFTPQTWWFDPLRGVNTVEEAERLAGHFVLTVDDPGHRDLWGPGATELLSALILAARLSNSDIGRVYDWLADDGNLEPVTILEARPQFSKQANGLRGMMNGAFETKQGLYQTARTAARCLRDPQILAWVTPPPAGSTTPVFDARAFVSSRDTLYLLSKDGGAGAGPLIAALTDRVMREAVRRAESLGGRLDPWLPVVLDEAANICKIADLPALASHLGSRGVVLLTILQSWAQGEGVWGRGGMQALWNATTIKLIGAGVDDAEFAERLSRLVGEHDVAVTSYSRGGRDNALSESVSLRRQRILGPDKIRAMAKGTALLLATGCPPALVQLLPWFSSPDAARISAAETEANQKLRQRAEMRDLMAS